MKMFYTHAGCTLVALNPFQPIPDLYTLDVMKEYHCAPQPQVWTKSQLSVTVFKIPYLFNRPTGAQEDFSLFSF